MTMTNDPISDMLTRIRNANLRKHKNVKFPYSKIKNEIANILLNEGFIKEVKIEQLDEKKVHKDIVIVLKYKGPKRVITNLKRISKPGLRVYRKIDEFPLVLNGFGIAIVSTSLGIMTTKEATQKKVGGELIAIVW